MRKSLDIVIPVYNEEDCISQTLDRLLGLRESLFEELDVNFIFVDDGSVDKSVSILKELSDKYPFVKVLSFTRNFGHQFAVCAGLDHSTADYVAIMDADLQDPPELIKDMYEKSKEGFQIVYGKRLKRKKETVFKKVTAFVYYRLFDILCQTKVPVDTGDFRLITRDVVNAIVNMPEKHKFLRAMIPWVGFKSAPVYYNRDERYAGKTKYSLSKMLKLASDGIFSFSIRPLKFIYSLSVFMSIIAFINLAIAFLFPQGFLFDMLIFSVFFVGALLTFSLAILGEYIGRIFEEVKGRPLYIVKSRFNL